MQKQSILIGLVIVVVATAVAFQSLNRRYQIRESGPLDMFQTKVDTWTGRTWERAGQGKSWTAVHDSEMTTEQIRLAEAFVAELRSIASMTSPDPKARIEYLDRLDAVGPVKDHLLGLLHYIEANDPDNRVRNTASKTIARVEKGAD